MRRGLRFWISSKQSLVENADSETVGFPDKFCPLRSFIAEILVVRLPVIFTSLAINRVDQELVKLFLHVVLRGSAHCDDR